MPTIFFVHVVFITYLPIQFNYLKSYSVEKYYEQIIFPKQLYLLRSYYVRFYYVSV